eukprot:6780191-Alexandrium_andersonii.AAC.1
MVVRPATAAGGTYEGRAGLTPDVAQSRCPGPLGAPPLLGPRAFSRARRRAVTNRVGREPRCAPRLA